MRNKITYIILAIIAFAFIWSCDSYNGLVYSQEEATTKFADLQSSYQRRSDLIPSLVETVKGAAAHEKSTLDAVISARAKATQVTVDPDNLTPEKLAEFQKAQGELSSALGRLMMITENYPQLKAIDAFRDLQVQLEGTENRINESRLKYNSAVMDYNKNVRRFPNAIFAGMFGFQTMTKFEAEEAAQKAPQFSFQ